MASNGPNFNPLSGCESGDDVRCVHGVTRCLHGDAGYGKDAVGYIR